MINAIQLNSWNDRNQRKRCRETQASFQSAKFSAVKGTEGGRKKLDTKQGSKRYSDKSSRVKFFDNPHGWVKGERALE